MDKFIFYIKYGIIFTEDTEVGGMTLEHVRKTGPFVYRSDAEKTLIELIKKPNVTYAEIECGHSKEGQ